MHLLPNNDDGGRYADVRQSELLATIKVPPALGRFGRNCKLDLPDAAYPEAFQSEESNSTYSDRYTDRVAAASEPESGKVPYTSKEVSSDKSNPRPKNALAEAKARGYKNGGMGIANNAASKAPARPLREKTNVVADRASKQRNEAAAKRPAVAARRYVSAANAVGRIPRAPAGRRRQAPAHLRRF